MKNFIKTAEKIEVLNYPYSFNLKTTLFDSIEFNSKKGYRHITQTINPKTGRVNNPKKSTYSPLLFRYYDEKGHIKTMSHHFNGDKEINIGAKFMAENFDLFSAEEINYIYTLIYSMARIDFKATCIYGGSKPEDLKPLYTDFLTLCAKGIKTGENVFNGLQLDTEAIENTKPANFNPFVITERTLLVG
tara:strand:+ start:756 stop:1322 length:567 start_codon:yes stop_codon:yes gene_type:complete